MAIVLDAATREGAEKIGAFKARAAEHSAAGRHMEAGEAHYARGKIHDSHGEHANARDAYRAACDCYAKHTKALNDAAGCALDCNTIRSWRARLG